MNLGGKMKENIQEYIIKDFIKKYKRVPSRSEVLEIYTSKKKSYPEIGEIGLSASNIKEDGETKIFYDAGSESSSSSVKANLEKTILDLNFLDLKYSSLIEEQRERSIDKSRIFKNIESKIKSLIKKINLEILLKGKQDIFSYGIVEDFEVRDKVIEDQTTARILDNNKVTIDHIESKETKINLREINFEVVHLRGNQISYNRFGALKEILEEDEKFFKVESASDIQDDIVEFVFSMNFRVPKNIEQIKYKLQAIQNNSKLQEEVYFSVNGADYYQLEMPGIVNSDINYIDFNNENILYKNITIKFRKLAYDYEKNGKFYYCLNFDYMGFLENVYRRNQESTIVLGPYEILNEELEPVNYSIATIKAGTCCEIPEMTSINFYLSKDGIDYIKCGFSEESSDVISFDQASNTNILEDFDLVDVNSESEFLIDDQELIKYDFSAHETALNIVLKENKRSNVNLNSLKIYRNVFTNKLKNNQSFYSGWKKVNDHFYECFIVLESSATVNFGSNRSLYVDGLETSGKVFLSEGKHKFKVSSYFFENEIKEKNILNERNLNRQTLDYPYNHKLLLEGFDYSNRFKGNKRYLKLGYMYASELEKVSADSFKNNNSYDSYSILDEGGDIYFLVKDVYSNGRFEEYDVKYNTSGGNDSNKLYVKAVLKTENTKFSPKIDQIQVRVI